MNLLFIVGIYDRLTSLYLGQVFVWLWSPCRCWQSYVLSCNDRDTWPSPEDRPGPGTENSKTKRYPRPSPLRAFPGHIPINETYVKSTVCLSIITWHFWASGYESSFSNKLNALLWREWIDLFISAIRVHYLVNLVWISHRIHRQRGNLAFFKAKCFWITLTCSFNFVYVAADLCTMILLIMCLVLPSIRIVYVFLTEENILNRTIYFFSLLLVEKYLSLGTNILATPPPVRFGVVKFKVGQ